MTTPYLRRPLAAPTTGHKWELDAKSGEKKCVRCGETYWNGPMRECIRVRGETR